jgi:hypothetical protein
MVQRISSKKSFESEYLSNDVSAWETVELEITLSRARVAGVVNGIQSRVIVLECEHVEYRQANPATVQ